MPQMSPLGWVWMVVFVIFGYVLFLMVCYGVGMGDYEVSVGGDEVKVNGWVW